LDGIAKDDETDEGGAVNLGETANHVVVLLSIDLKQTFM
jgi:hypothetical protein